MNRQNLKNFASQMGISEKTLKRKFGDCIYRLGRQSYIDVHAFNEVFIERTAKGRKQQRKITESTSIGRIQMHLDKAQVKLEHVAHIVTNKKKAVEAAEDDRSRRVAIIGYGQAQMELRGLEKLISRLSTRIDELLDKGLEKYRVPELSPATKSPKGK